jgi:subtilisin family serine protease
MKSLLRKLKFRSPATPEQPHVDRQNQSAGRWAVAIEAEVCESRLVLSAVPLADVFMHSQLDLETASEPQSNLHLGDLASSADNGSGYDDVRSHGGADYGPQAPTAWTPELNPQLESAHGVSGLTEARQMFGLTGGQQTVAIIDSGIAWDHQALGGGFGAGYRVVGGWDFAENDALPYDDAPAGFHGTHVAGIVGSQNAVHSGVAPGADLVSLRVFDDSGHGEIAWVEQSLQWVLENKDTFENPITTVNLSLGTAWNSDSVPAWSQLEDEFRELNEQGIVVVASAGNSFKQYNTPGLSYPAASPYVLPVASLDDTGLISDFSQRNERVLAAPGRSIMSSVPDHVFGSDGVVNDFASASGTSMAAPYVAGASLLVREAFELVGYANVTFDQIVETLRGSADSVYDAATNLSFDRLNISNALQSIIPNDTVAGELSDAQAIQVGDGLQLDGWINRLGDVDMFQFSAQHTGRLSIDLETFGSGLAASSLQWQAFSGGSLLDSGNARSIDFEAISGQTYAIAVQSNSAIGRYELDFSWNSIGNGNGAGQEPTQRIGQTEFWQQSTESSERIQFVAGRTGPAALGIDIGSYSGNGITLYSEGRAIANDATLENGLFEIQTDLVAGQTYELQLPTAPGITSLVNVIEATQNAWSVHGTDQSDTIRLDLAEHTVAVNQFEFEYSATLGQLHVDAGANNDHIQITGSSIAEKFELRSQSTFVTSTEVSISVINGETVNVIGGGGPDRAYLYDSLGDDTFHAYPLLARLEGTGYAFEVIDVDRVFINGTSGGNDSAFLNDSAGNDVLSIRPQFSSLRGDGFFTYVAGFERVYAYGTEGGHDVATLYDSPGDDQFNSSGMAASIVSSGLFSFTRGFEQVEAFASAGGSDTAALYAQNASEISAGVDFVSLNMNGLSRLARGFEVQQGFVNGGLQSLAGLNLGGLLAVSLEDVSGPDSRSPMPIESPQVGRSIEPIGQLPAGYNETVHPSVEGTHEMFRESSRWKAIPDATTPPTEWETVSQDDFDAPVNEELFASPAERELLESLEWINSDDREARLTAELFDRHV